MAEEAVGLEEGLSAADGPLVAVTFQRNVHRKEKYLESEPKALGITQIGLSVFMIISTSVFLSNGLSHVGGDIAFFITSLVVLVAGSVAVAAQKLHLPTLRACLGMQISASVVSVFNIIFVVVRMEDVPYYCWQYDSYNNTAEFGEICHRIEDECDAVQTEAMFH
ncbi:uncharacterized protein LOC115386183 isoform X2 [Salarias fasciatus]|uniref:uncharacterized protein LOC115386183 isoform X2 n=1 Tax=Salarias fasciatus TaxID=181472 RepID=UPI0011767E45|nr:uncharacterized protein LOC115386183 isoform X2 [Salarias fasciatus]